MLPKIIHVAAAAIFNEAGELLLALRSKGQHQGGLWEFPGGKVEPGEDVRQALARELHEELGIEIDQQATRPLIKVPYHYPDKSVLLEVFRVDRFSGEPYGREGQPVRWVKLNQLHEYPFPAANKPIVNAVLLPSRIAITATVTSLEGYLLESYLPSVEQALNKGAEWVMLRAKQLEGERLIGLAVELKARLSELGGGLILNGSIAEGNAASVDALHLTSQRLMALNDRTGFNGRWLGASCHSQAQLNRAVELGLDYVTLSPVNHTTTHPDEEGLGWEQFAQLAEQQPIPVFALGGVDLEDLNHCWSCGGQGIAAISAFR
ncbi:MAG: Nudix family hydrolase [Amphritea sp.]